jgi:hypothetical protein
VITQLLLLFVSVCQGNHVVVSGRNFKGIYRLPSIVERGTCFILLGTTYPLFSRTWLAGLVKGHLWLRMMAIGPRVASPDAGLCAVSRLFFFRDENVDVCANRRRDVNHELSPRGTVVQVAHTSWRFCQVHGLRSQVCHLVRLGSSEVQAQ